MAKAREILTDRRYAQFQERYYDDLLGYVLDNSRHTPTWQQVEFLKAVSQPGCRVAVSSGHGCFGKGTPVLMYDGSVKPVEEVDYGDRVMGDDYTPRRVLTLCRGRERMYRFTFKDGTEHVYNESHLLCLVIAKKNGGQTRYEKTLKFVYEYLSWGTVKKRAYTAYRRDHRWPDLIIPLPITKITPLDEGDYYGFVLDGNMQFLSGDLMVLHNTGKSWALAWALDWHLRVFHFSNALLTATNIGQARSVVWKYLDEVVYDMEAMYPWQAGYFVKETMRYFAAPHKDSWYVIPKTASKAKPENLAGQHNINYMVVVDEASGVDDVIHDVLRGAMTHERNRYVMTSQPTRPNGHFAEAMTKMAKKSDGSGIYTAITMNSELSPMVSKSFIREKMVEYGGHHSPEYQIRVLGNLPDNLSGYLIPRSWCVRSLSCKITHAEAWGYVLCCDVAEGVHRDSSVMTLFKVSGSGSDKMLEAISCDEYLDLNEKQFARRIAAKFNELPALTVAVDADGAGRTVILELEEMGIPVHRIHWGLPCHTSADQRRYFNQRAYAHYKLREAIFDERFKGPDNKQFVDQASRLPYKIDERGRYQMLPKDQMKSQGIKSPDVSDTCCFAFLVDYIPAEANTHGVGSEEDRLLQLAKEMADLHREAKT